MKKLTVSIGSLGSASAGDYVDFNIWQGKRLLVSDRIEGRHTGTFYREYDVGYTRSEPLRIESNAPAGCAVCVHMVPCDELFHSCNAAGMVDAASTDTDIYKLIAKRFEFYHPNGEPVSATGCPGRDGKTLEQRVADLEKQLADSRNDTISSSDAASILEAVSAETAKIIREKNTTGFSADISLIAEVNPDSGYVFIIENIRPDRDEVKVDVRVASRQCPEVPLFWVSAPVGKSNDAKLGHYEDEGIRIAKSMIIDIAKWAAL